jgi:hypothetical protein
MLRGIAGGSVCRGAFRRFPLAAKKIRSVNKLRGKRKKQNGKNKNVFHR